MTIIIIPYKIGQKSDQKKQIQSNLANMVRQKFNVVVALGGRNDFAMKLIVQGSFTDTDVVDYIRSFGYEANLV